MADVNYLAVVVAAVAAFVAGWIWYGPIFGKMWGRLHHMEMPSGQKMPMQAMVLEFLCALVTAYVLANFISMLGVMDASGAIKLVVWVWVGFYATTIMGSVLWEKGNWGVYGISVGGRLLGLLVMAFILSAWH